MDSKRVTKIFGLMGATFAAIALFADGKATEAFGVISAALTSASILGARNE